jgi:hypothetical protein
MGLACVLAQRIELPGLNVAFKLPVPRRGVELGEPLAKGRELVG